MRDAMAGLLQDRIMRFLRHPLWCQVSTWPLRGDPVHRAREYRYKRHRGNGWMT